MMSYRSSARGTARSVVAVAIRLTHAALGLPADLEGFGVYKAFLDARQLTDQT